jgi:hypothetical protein
MDGFRGNRSSRVGPLIAFAVEEIVGFVAKELRVGAHRAVSHGPFDSVSDHPPDVLVVVDRELRAAVVRAPFRAGVSTAVARVPPLQLEMGPRRTLPQGIHNRRGHAVEFDIAGT